MLLQFVSEKGRLFFLPLCFLLTASIPAHEYHVSVTHMQYNPAEKLIEVSIRIFTDDLERALSENNGKRRFVIGNNDQNNSFIESYIRKNFVFFDSGKKNVPVHFLGKEQEEDATWIYMEIPYSASLTACSLQNSTLMDTFADQVNMTNVKYGNEKRTYLFKKGQPIHIL
ncbi:DUF6702 family protein [Dyadobacter helix]|nr:DUF6702 family protein [Dyadobacter sp. CECT 9275]